MMTKDNLLQKFYEIIKRYKPMKFRKDNASYTHNLMELSSYLKKVDYDKQRSRGASQLIKYLYQRNLDIMFLYEFVVASKNLNSFKSAESIALLKRHTRHNIPSITNNTHNSFKVEPGINPHSGLIV